MGQHKGAACYSWKNHSFEILTFNFTTEKDFQLWEKKKKIEGTYAGHTLEGINAAQKGCLRRQVLQTLSEYLHHSKRHKTPKSSHLRCNFYLLILFVCKLVLMMLHRGHEFNSRALVISLHGLPVMYKAAQILFLTLNYVLLHFNSNLIMVCCKLLCSFDFWSFDCPDGDVWACLVCLSNTHDAMKFALGNDF